MKSTAKWQAFQIGPERCEETGLHGLAVPGRLRLRGVCG